MDKEAVIAELRRVASTLGSTYLTKAQFRQHGRISLTTARRTFGSWTEAMVAAGLDAMRSGPPPAQARPDEDYLLDIIRLTKELGREPTTAHVSAHGQFSETPYRRRWGSVRAACQAAYAKYGFPTPNQETNGGQELLVPTSIPKPPPVTVIPQTFAPANAQQRKKIQFGEPIHFRGLRFAPINEQGVVYLFGMVSRELGFLIESIRTEYPDCEGKRCVDAKKQRWEHVLIEFEYCTSHFRVHGHSPEGCDLIVCWVHDWNDCPVEVLELRSQIKYLPNQS